MSFDDWSDVFAFSLYWGGGIRWHLGDLLVYGEREFGESYSQALPDEMPIERQTLANYVWVSRAVEPSRRNPKLPWEHHKIVAGQPAEAQSFWLDLAEENGWASRELRRAMQGKQIEGVDEERAFPRSASRVLGEFLLLPLASETEISTWLDRLLEEEKEALAKDAGAALDQLSELLDSI